MDEKKKIERIYKMKFSEVFPLYIKKVEKKGRSKEDVKEIIFWLTGYNESSLQNVIDQGIDFETFFKNAPKIHPNASKITGSICGYKVEEIEDFTIRHIRYLDKLVDELAHGKTMEKILRK